MHKETIANRIETALKKHRGKIPRRLVLYIYKSQIKAGTVFDVPAGSIFVNYIEPDEIESGPSKGRMLWLVEFIHSHLKG